MAGEATLGVALQMTGDTVTPALQGLSGTLADNKMAIRELAMGTTMLGASFMAVGVAMKGSNNQMMQSVGQTVMMAGSIMTALGSTVQFISAISKTVDALKKLAASEAIVNALTNHLFLLLGVGAAVGVVAGINAMNKGDKKAGVVTTANVNVHVTGPGILDTSTAAAALAPAIQQQIGVIQKRTAGSGAMP